MKRCPPRCRSFVWLLLGLAGLLSGPAVITAQPPPSPEEVSYRLIHAPWERIFELTEGREEYRKMTREDFFAHVRAVQQALPIPVATGVSLRQATYTARLEGDAFVDGQAEWEIESLPEKLATFPLETMDLAIETAAWTSPEAGPATIGSTPRGELVLLVPQSGTLQLSWSRRAAEQRPDELLFAFQLPPAPTSRMELTLPSEYVLSSPHGIVRAAPRPGEQAADRTTGPPTTVWQVDLGGQQECQLQVRRTNFATPAAYVHQVDNYRLSEQGLELTAELHLDCPERPLRQLALRVDPLLRLTKARAGDEAVNWTSSQEDDASARSIVLTFPEPIQGRNRIVSISALAPLPESAAWVLPRIQAQQVRWEQQVAWLQLASPLVLRRLQLDQARQIPPREAIAADDVRIGVQYLASTARMELEIDRQPAECEVTSGTTVLLGGGGATAEIRTHIRATTRELFAFCAEVARGWNIRSVEAEDRELVHDWQIRRSPAAGRVLEVRLARPLDPRTPARLRIQARRQSGVGSEPIPLAQLRPLTFSEGLPGPRHFLAVLPEENLMTVFSGDEQMPWLILDDLDNVEAPLVQVQPRDPIIPLDSQYEDAFVALRPLPPDELPFSAEVQITARLTPKELLEQYRLALDRSPAAGGPLRVRLSPWRGRSAVVFRAGSAADIAGTAGDRGWFGTRRAVGNRLAGVIGDHASYFGGADFFEQRPADGQSVARAGCPAAGGHRLDRGLW